MISKGVSMKCEVGVITAHPIVYMWKQIKTIFRTWMFCRRSGIACNKWFGVFCEGEELILAQTGCLPDAEGRAKLIAKAMNAEETP